MHERLRPRFEVLEGRAMPSILAVTTTLDVVAFADGKQSLREAISLANDLEGPDTILLPAGVYRIAIDGADENGNATGDFDVLGDVAIRGAGAGLTVIDGQRIDRLFDLLDPIDVRFKGVTLQKGGDSDNRNVNGGAIQTLSADLTMVDCVVRGNFGKFGGAINNESGNVTLNRCTVAGNTAGNSGGGIRVATGALTMTDSAVRRNLCRVEGGGVLAGAVEATRCTFADNTSGNSGGGILTENATLTRCTISGNRAASGGGLFANQDALVARCTIVGNIAAANGGGIAFASGGTVSRSTICSNTAGGGSGGGGIIAVAATLESCTISGNASLVDGGGVTFLNGGSVTSCTVAGNRAVGVGGGLFRISSATLLVEVRNSIIATNTAAFGDFSGLFVDVFGDFTSRGSNLIGVGAGSTGFENGVKNDQVGFFASPINPKLGPLADNGGPTKTHALLAGSPAIDRGDSNVPQLIDQRGQPRKKDGNGDRSAIVDIGAFER
jgi:predicted outer membrane repeat protein